MSEPVWKRIEASRARHNVLAHPLDVRWSAGELSADELAAIPGQPPPDRGAGQAHGRHRQLAPEPHRDEIERDAAESRSTSALGRLAQAAGGEIGAEPTRRDRRARARLDSARLPVALARLYAIESGQPEISRIKREGLAEFYGIDGGAGSEYFRVHESTDEAMPPSPPADRQAMVPDDEDAVVEAAESAFKANCGCSTASARRLAGRRPSDRDRRRHRAGPRHRGRLRLPGQRRTPIDDPSLFPERTAQQERAAKTIPWGARPSLRKGPAA